MAPRSTSTHRRSLPIDAVLIVSTVLVAAIGIIMVFTATRGTLLADGLDPHYFLKRQLVFVLLGIGGMAVMGLIDYRRLQPLGMIIYGLSVVSLLGVFVAGHNALGSQRWYSLPGGLQLQPSEFAVLALIAAVATYCSRRTEGLTWTTSSSC